MVASPSDIVNATSPCLQHPSNHTSTETHSTSAIRRTVSSRMTLPNSFSPLIASNCPPYLRSGFRKSLRNVELESLIKVTFTLFLTETL